MLMVWLATISLGQLNQWSFIGLFETNLLSFLSLVDSLAREGARFQ